MSDLVSTAKDILKRIYSNSSPTMTSNTGAAPNPNPDPSKYNTPLDIQEENGYRDWLSARNRYKTDHGEEPDFGHDYDLRGWWKKNVGLNPTVKTYLDSTGHEGHMTDEFKKPNHRTFSTESIYSGVDGYQGGTWEGEDNKPGWTFTPSEEMKARSSRQELSNYFTKYESGNKLNWPDAGATPTTTTTTTTTTATALPKSKGQ